MGGKQIRVRQSDVERLARVVKDAPPDERTFGHAITRVLNHWEDGTMAKRIGPGPRAIPDQPDAPPAGGTAEALVPAAQVDVWRGALAALDAAREAVRQCAVYASSRPGQSHQGAVENLSGAVENIGTAAGAVTRARAEVEAAEWQSGAGA